MCIVQSVTGHAGREERKTEAAALRHQGKQGGKEGGKGRRGVRREEECYREERKVGGMERNTEQEL